MPVETDVDTAYAMVSDPTAMARLASEVVDARWLEGGPAAVGARFRGYNRNGRRCWTTTWRVTDADRSTYAYEVYAPVGIRISRWQYDVERAPTAGTCVVTETNWIKVPGWFVPIAIATTGVSDRPEANRAHIGGTLARLEDHLETN